jgi:dihydropteroate synthase
VAAPKDRVTGSLAAHVAAALGGADMIRAHDVAAHRDALRMVDALKAA